MEQLRAGDLVFVKGSSFVDKAIEDITHSQYSHVALVVNGDTLIEAQGREPVEYVPSTKYSGYADVYRSDLSGNTLQAIIAHASDQLGEHYGYKLIGVELVREVTGIQLPFDEDKEPICSVLISDAIRSQGVGFCQGIEYPSPGDEAYDGLYRHVFSY